MALEVFGGVPGGTGVTAVALALDLEDGMAPEAILAKMIAVNFVLGGDGSIGALLMKFTQRTGLGIA